MSNAAVTAAHTNYTAARSIWDHCSTDASYSNMRRLYAIWQQAARDHEYSEEREWAAHNAICEKRGWTTT